jgi:hypothetical protein
MKCIHCKRDGPTSYRLFNCAVEHCRSEIAIADEEENETKKYDFLCSHHKGEIKELKEEINF